MSDRTSEGSVGKDRVMEMPGAAEIPQGNIFRESIQCGRIKTVSQLKRYFRVLAVKVHPDTSMSRDGNDRFIKLEEDYRAAEAFLLGAAESGGTGQPPVFRSPRAQAPKQRPSREQIYGDFFELEASNFPINLPLEKRSRAYRERVAGFNEEIGELGVLGGKSFLDLESELYKLRENWRIFDPIKNIFYNIVSWHIEPRDFTRQRITEDFDRVRPLLEEAGAAATLAFLSWLIGDLANGSSLGPGFRSTIKNHQRSLE